MNKSPAFQFYPLDFLQGTKLMSMAERGAYITLLCEQWDALAVSDRPIELARLFGVSTEAAAELWKGVRRKFVRAGGGRWRNERLEKERQKQIARREALARNGAQGGRGKAKGKQKQSNSFTGEKQKQSNSLAKAKPGAENLTESLSSSAVQDHLLKEREDDRTPVVPSSPAALRGRFDAFWAEYPNKKAKDAAWRRWQQLKPSPELTAQILQAIRNQRSSRQWRDGFIPNPATWLHDQRWSDEPEIQVDRGTPAETAMPFWDECAKCGDVHPVGQPCPPKPGARA